MNIISETIVNYEPISKDIKFLPKSMIRLKILRTLYESPMNMKEVNIKTRINYSAISTNMHMMELEGYIYREKNNYFLSNSMRLYMDNIIKLDKLMILLDRIAPISYDHNVKSIPRDSIYNMNYLEDVEVMETDELNAYKTFDFIEKSITKSKYIKAILPFSYNDFNESLNKLASKDRKISLISPVSIKEILVRSLRTSNNNLEIDYIDFDEDDYLFLFCSDKRMIVGFFKCDGSYDKNRLLTSSNGKCIKWANELFDNFKKEKNLNEY